MFRAASLICCLFASQSLLAGPLKGLKYENTEGSSMFSFVEDYKVFIFDTSPNVSGSTCLYWVRNPDKKDKFKSEIMENVEYKHIVEIGCFDGTRIELAVSEKYSFAVDKKGNRYWLN